MQSSERLEQFFGGYFHQDCLLDDPDWESVVRRYRNETPKAEVALLAKEIDSLVAEAPSEAELEQHVLEKLGCYYTPRPDLGGPSFSAWLGQISAVLEAK